MKKIICMLLAALFLLSGCQASVSETTAPPETTVAPIETTTPAIVPEATVPELVIREPGEGDIAFENPGKARIAYTGNRSYVKYVTSVDQLPNEEALAGYDEAFFEDKALLILVDTVTSGSVQLEIGSIQTSGDTAIVDIKRTMSGDVGTTDMATWMLWAEVEKGLDYTWQMKDRDQAPTGEKY